MSIHLCTAESMGMAEECQCCGGWIHADGCVPKGCEPYHLPDGSGIFCSIECADDIAEMIDQRRGAS